MSKDPAFLFYSNDFLAGVQDLTMEERGQYITLLCVLHQKGRINDKTIRLCVGNAAADVLAKFRQDSAGLWYNERLEKEIEKRRAHADKQRLRATEGWKKRKNEENSKSDTSHGIATALPLEDEDRDEDVNEVKSKIKKQKAEIVFPFISDQFMKSWDNWKDYKYQEWKFKYKSSSSEQASLMELNKLSRGNEQTAMAIILQSISNGWKGFFELKNKSNEQFTRKDTLQDLTAGFKERASEFLNRG